MATRWYRAPEIMLNWMHYNQTGDVNSWGCLWLGTRVGRLSSCQGLGMGVGRPQPRTWGCSTRGGLQGLGAGLSETGLQRSRVCWVLPRAVSRGGRDLGRIWELDWRHLGSPPVL